MAEKWMIAFEVDLKQGVCVLARKDAGSERSPGLTQRKRHRSGSNQAEK
jgi:hypothetical protein